MRLLSPQTLNAHSMTRHRKSQSFVYCFGFSREWNPGQDRYLKVESGTSQMYVYAGQFREIFLALLEHSGGGGTDAHAYLVEPGRDGEYTLGTCYLECVVYVPYTWRGVSGMAFGDCLGLCSSDDMYVVYL